MRSHGGSMALSLAGAMIVTDPGFYAVAVPGVLVLGLIARAISMGLV